MSIEQNKQIALEWVRTTVAGDVAAARALFTDSARLLVVGDMPNCGWMDLDAFYSQATVLPLAGPITMEIGELTAEGDRVWFEAQSDAELVGGQRYNNYYVFGMRIRDGRIYEYREYADTLYSHRVIDNPIIRGTPIARGRTIDKPVASFTGNAVASSLDAG